MAEHVAAQEPGPAAGGLAIQIGEEGIAYMKQNLSSEELGKAQVVPDFYWAVAAGANGKAIYKSPNGLYLYFKEGHEAGWYIVADFVQDHKQWTKLDPAKIYAWLGNGKLPHSLHMPYFKKKAVPDAAVVCAFDYQKQRIPAEVHNYLIKVYYQKHLCFVEIDKYDVAFMPIVEWYESRMSIASELKPPIYVFTSIL